ncbi:MAG: DUF1735 domain-containing protein [Bacteroidota bacterium]
MKKIALALTLFTATVFGLTGCLKDKGFDNHDYGINDPDTQPPGVGFPNGSKPRTDFGLDVSTTSQPVNSLVYVNLESGTPASSDVHITLTNNTTALLAAYNAANNLTGTNAVLPLPANLYNVVLAMTIPAGGRNVQVPINVTNTTTLDANRLYAVGLTITGADGGYTIASNLKNLFIVFSVKNRFDGKYTMKGKFYHPTNDPAFSPHTLQVELHTTGPNSVKLYWPLVSAYATPLTVAGSPACCFADQELGFTVNPTTNAMVVSNVSPTAATAYDPIAYYPTPASSFSNRWDPATKTFYAAWGYSLGAGNTVLLGASRAWIDTLIRTGPR